MSIITTISPYPFGEAIYHIGDAFLSVNARLFTQTVTTQIPTHGTIAGQSGITRIVGSERQPNSFNHQFMTQNPATSPIEQQFNQTSLYVLPSGGGAIVPILPQTMSAQEPEEAIVPILPQTMSTKKTSAKETIAPASAFTSRLNFPHAYNVIALIGAVNRVIAISEEDERLCRALSELKAQVEENGLPKTRKEISKDLDENLVEKYGLPKNREEISSEDLDNLIQDEGLPESSEKIGEYLDRQIVEVNEQIRDERWNKGRLEEEEANLVSCENEIARLNRIKEGLHSARYYLKPNAFMTMRPSVIVELIKGKRTFDTLKQHALIYQEPYNHVKIDPVVPNTSAPPKVGSKHSTLCRGSSFPASELVPPSEKGRTIGLPIRDQKNPKVLSESFISRIEEATASKGTAIRDPLQPRDRSQPRTGQLAPDPTRSVPSRRAGFVRQFKLTEEQVRMRETALRAWESLKKLNVLLQGPRIDDYAPGLRKRFQEKQKKYNLENYQPIVKFVEPALKAETGD